MRGVPTCESEAQALRRYTHARHHVTDNYTLSLTFHPVACLVVAHCVMTAFMLPALILLPGCCTAGVFESWLHPSRYRTQLCKDQEKCDRPVCFFAHNINELRSPVDSFVPNPEERLRVPEATQVGALAPVYRSAFSLVCFFVHRSTPPPVCALFLPLPFWSLYYVPGSFLSSPSPYAATSLPTCFCNSRAHSGMPS